MSNDTYNVTVQEAEKTNSEQEQNTEEEKKVTGREVIQGRTIALIDLKGHVIQLVQDQSGNVYMYEKWSQDEDIIEIELGAISEDQVIEEITKVISEEFKLPKSVRGALKAKIKQVKLPITARLIQEERANIVDIRGSRGKFQLAVKYYIQ